MSRLDQDLDELAVFFDPAAVAGALQDSRGAFGSSADERTSCPAQTSVATVSDQELLQRLLPQEAYLYWKEAGYLGQYCMSFMLRHAAAFLSLGCHMLARPDAGLLPAFKKNFTLFDMNGAAEYAALLAVSRTDPAGSFPLVGFSALGIHLLERPAGACRAFDYYAAGACCEHAQGLFCAKHSSEAWWRTEGTAASTQADMLRFYALRENLHAFQEQDLKELAGRFWARMRQFKPLEPDGLQVETALAAFGYGALPELTSDGQAQLRKRYIEKARELHPDSGGGHEVFIRLKNHYDLLLQAMYSRQ